jgi:hypothetical protein
VSKLLAWHELPGGAAWATIDGFRFEVNVPARAYHWNHAVRTTWATPHETVSTGEHVSIEEAKAACEVYLTAYRAGYNAAQVHHAETIGRLRKLADERCGSIGSFP